MIISEKKSPPIWNKNTKSKMQQQQQQQQQQHHQYQLQQHPLGISRTNRNLSDSKTSLLSSTSSTDDFSTSTSISTIDTTITSPQQPQQIQISNNFELDHLQNSPIATTYLPGLSTTTSLSSSLLLPTTNNNNNNKNNSNNNNTITTNVHNNSNKLLLIDNSKKQLQLQQQHQQNLKSKLYSKSLTTGTSPLPSLKNFKNTKDITQLATTTTTTTPTTILSTIDQKENNNNKNCNNNSFINNNEQIRCHSVATTTIPTTANAVPAAITTQSTILISNDDDDNNNDNNSNNVNNNNNSAIVALQATSTTNTIDIDEYDDDYCDDDNLSTKNLISMGYQCNNNNNKKNDSSSSSDNISKNNYTKTKTTTTTTTNNKNGGNSNKNNHLINNSNYGNGKIYNSINNSQNLYNDNISIDNNISSNSNNGSSNCNSGSNNSDDDNNISDNYYQQQKNRYPYKYHNSKQQQQQHHNGASYGGNNNSTYLTRCCIRFPLLKAINVKRCVVGLVLITFVTIFYYTKYFDNGVFVGLIHRDTRPAPLIHCRMLNGGNNKQIVSAQTPDHRSEARLRIDPKVLVFVETTYSRLGRDIAELLVYNRIKYKIEVAGKSLPVLTNLDKGRYGVIIFENLDKYLHMDKWNRELLDKYCREYSVGIVGFVSPSEETLVAAQLRGFPVYIHTNLRLRDASLNPASSVLRLTRAGDTAWGVLPGDDWTIFQHNHSTYEPIEWAQRNTQEYTGQDGGGQIQPPLATVLQDHGQFDGIQRIFFGSSLRFWLHRLLFLDALSYLSHGQLSLSLNRMILVDVDDIFVGEKGTRLRPDDVSALISTQKQIAEMVPGFRFNLGFSGKYYHHGTHDENLGDDLLLRNIGEFNWFSHMWNHQQPHLYENLTILMNEMMQNYAFAKDHGIPTDSSYSVSPHHSGVYPAHELLYTAWKKVWNIKVTSTEEYPHLRPARLRRGFIHRNIMVLPRQTCGLFTHTMYIDRYPGGRDKLDESIQGGELFQTIVYNPINIFMTHMSNYGSDRLALYTFESVIKFLRCWTNLKLSSAPPLQLGDTYFRLHPEETDPVWGNPCEDPRHLKIWSKQKDCDSLPKFLVIGPQKTGTTALYTFLSMHPSIASNIPSPDTFEEIQFFNGNNYYRGLDWYMTFFPTTSNTTTRYMFEKSATYFDGDLVPRRSHSLLPHAKIVTILISPAKRAYSWYQHTKAHGDLIANNYSFYQVITAGDSAPKSLKDLRNRCLNPGKYAQHLERWLAYYPAQQLHIIDGEQLKSNPVDVMNELQRFLKIQPPFDYSNHLRFDNKKGFYCQVVGDNRNKCLGKSKGRQYPPMDDRSLKLLQRFYLSHNTALVKLLKKLGSRPIPQWLKDDLSTTSS